MSGSPPLALGIDLGGTKIHAELLDADGQCLWRSRIPTPSHSYREVLGAMAGLVTEARQAAAARKITVGVGGPGSVSSEGRIKNANTTCLNGQRLVHDLQALIGQPLRYANDANCLALSEAVDGAGSGFPVVFGVILGTGVGGGLALQAKVIEGPNRLSGEWGHNPLPWMDEVEQRIAITEPCWCGKHGCIESFLSGPALARDHLRHATGQKIKAAPLTAAEIAQAAAAGDATSQATLARHAARLARALASVINLLDPDVIVLAGGLSQLPGLPATLAAQWEPWVFRGGSEEPLRTRVFTARHGDASGVRGAAWLWR